MGLSIHTQPVTGTPAPRPLAAWLGGSPYVGYTYGYPHKTAYRPLAVAQPLDRLWATPDEALSLYLHVPFCEYRCGFCNLFTQAQPAAGWVTQYLKVLRSEAETVKAALGFSHFARLAFGGGTPTFLNQQELESLFSIAVDVMGADPKGIPTSMEASPATLDPAKLALIRERGVERLSLGVQTLSDAESSGLGRPQRVEQVHRALEMVRAAGLPVLNVDLIYGGEGQTVASWLESIRTVLRYEPEEIYLYPLYVRPLTGLGRREHDWDDQRLEAYRAGRDFLLERGYEQVSMRMFCRRAADPERERQPPAPAYCCQRDGMIGLGCGARSYAPALHYSTEYAVGRSGVQSILADYLKRSPDQFAAASYGIALTEDEQRRRFVLLSLLQSAGLSLDDYSRQFKSNLWDDLPALAELLDLDLAAFDTEVRQLRLNAAGLERSDTIGPWLYSERVRHLMETAACR